MISYLLIPKLGNITTMLPGYCIEFFLIYDNVFCPQIQHKSLDDQFRLQGDCMGHLQEATITVQLRATAVTFRQIGSLLIIAVLFISTDIFSACCRIRLHWWAQVVRDTCLCNSRLNSPGCYLVFYIKAKLQSTYVILQLDCHSSSLIVEEFLSQIFDVLSGMEVVEVISVQWEFLCM